MKIKDINILRDTLFSKKYQYSLNTLENDIDLDIELLQNCETFDSAIKALPEELHKLIPQLLLHICLVNEQTAYSDDLLTKVMAKIESKEQLFFLFREYHKCFSIDFIFEKIVPYIEHYYAQSQELLLSLAEHYPDETILFVTNLSVAQYIYADKLLDWLEQNLIKQTDDKSRLTKLKLLFEKNRADIAAIEKNRMLLFPKVVEPEQNNQE